MQLSHIFVDMDGVLADFVKAALALHDRSEALETWPLGEFNMAKVLGISTRQFWDKIDSAGTGYWSDLERYSWCEELVSNVVEHAPMAILSSPSLSPDCAAGKLEWLQNFFGRGFRDFLIGPQKHLCARPDAVLIDDSDRNVDRFREHGGHAVLFPQPWNSNHAIDDRIGFVKEQLLEIRDTVASYATT